MSTRERTTELVRSPLDDEMDALEALRFAKEPLQRTIVGILEDDDDAEATLAIPAQDADATLAIVRSEAQTQGPRQEDVEAVARRLTMKLELKEIAKMAASIPGRSPRMLPASVESAGDSVRDSLITVPPSVGSMPPATMAPLPGPPPLPRIGLDARGPLAPRGLVPDAALPREPPAGRGTWALLAGAIAAAIPAGLLLGQALTPVHAAAQGDHAASAYHAEARDGVRAARPGASASANATPTPPPTASTLVIPEPAAVVVRAPKSPHGSKKSKTKHETDATPTP